MKHVVTAVLALLVLVVYAGTALHKGEALQEAPGDSTEVLKEFKVYPIGYVRKSEGRTTIVIDKKYQPALHRLDQLSEIWVLWWFDRNDTPEGRSVLQVHPQGNLDKPLTGVFATHSPMRPNLIAMTRCKLISVKENVIEIEEIDAFADTPVLDIKS
jgi:tRNA-Thr(GGU) m(6)t(6)A37 methyltransferase TsaA